MCSYLTIFSLQRHWRFSFWRMLFYGMCLKHTHCVEHETERTLPLLVEKPCTTERQVSTIHECVHERYMETFLGVECWMPTNFDLQVGHTKPAGTINPSVSGWFLGRSLLGFSRAQGRVCSCKPCNRPFGVSLGVDESPPLGVLKDVDVSLRDTA